MRQPTARTSHAPTHFGAAGTLPLSRSGTNALPANPALRVLFFSLVAALVAAGTAYFLSSIQPPRYLAETTLVFSTMQTEGIRTSVGELQLAPVSVEAYRNLPLSRGFARQALSSLGEENVTDQQLEEFAERLSVNAEEAGTSALLHIRFTHENLQRSGTVVEALTQELAGWERSRVNDIVSGAMRELDVQIASLESTAALLMQVGMSARAAVAQAEADQLAVESASLEGLRGNVRGRFDSFGGIETHTDPVYPKPIRNAVVAGVIAAVACYAIWLVREANMAPANRDPESAEFA